MRLNVDVLTYRLNKLGESICEIAEEIKRLINEFMADADYEEYASEAKRPLFSLMPIYRYIPKFKCNLPYHRRVYIV